MSTQRKLKIRVIPSEPKILRLVFEDFPNIAQTIIPLNYSSMHGPLSPLTGLKLRFPVLLQVVLKFVLIQFLLARRPFQDVLRINIDFQEPVWKLVVCET